VRDIRSNIRNAMLLAWLSGQHIHPERRGIAPSRRRPVVHEAVGVVLAHARAMVPSFMDPRV
jgi:hypothetical protein